VCQKKKYADRNHQGVVWVAVGGSWQVVFPPCTSADIYIPPPLMTTMATTQKLSSNTQSFLHPKRAKKQRQHIIEKCFAKGK